MSRILVPPTGASAHLVFVRHSGFLEFFGVFLKIFEIFEWGGKFWGHVGFIRDSGEDIFFSRPF